MTVTRYRVQTAAKMIFDYLETWPGTKVEVIAENEDSWATAAYPDPFGVGRTHIRTYLMTARHLFHGAATLLTSATSFGEETLARASIEASASAYHLANCWPEPHVFVKQATIDRIWSLEEKRKMFDGATEEPANEERAATMRRADRATSYGVDKGFWTSDSSTVAGGRELVGRCRSLFMATPETAGSPGTYYRYLSGAAHSNPSVILALGQDQETPSDRRLMIPLAAAAFGLETANDAVAAMTDQPLEREPFDVFRTLTGQIM